MDDGVSPNPGILKKFFSKMKLNKEDVTEEEIMSMVDEGHEQGVLLESEAEMIHNIIEFDEKKADDIMTHRKSMVAIDGEVSLEDAMSSIIENKYSRYPVYLNDIDNIIGILHIKDLLHFVTDQTQMKTPVKDIDGLLRAVHFSPETRSINMLFREMQSTKDHMVIVVDEYGQTAGLIAMEDILEEIVGNILDEHDEEDVLMEKTGPDTYLIRGMAALDDVSELLGIEFETDDYDTLNGFLISLIDKIPEDDEEIAVCYHGYRFEVLDVEDKMIRNVKVSKVRADGNTPEGDTSCQTNEKVLE